ncbi:unnamed protein product [Durusdinium trenchii]|uniref:Uncharacterized protein n=1 Tax=Durusdinium trenchii TaxID=1381693 RepID=A0ABP0S7E7_9DINO
MQKKKEQQKRRSDLGGQDPAASASGLVSDSRDRRPLTQEKKALAFRRLQVQIKIEEFLKSYTRGQNLVKINARGKRYARRVYVDTAKRALVVQGANGPKFFPFAAMKEVDLETRTTKEGRVETLVICAIEKEGRIVKDHQILSLAPATCQYLCQLRQPFAINASQEKLERGDEDVAEIGSQANHKTQLDPVLAQRWDPLTRFASQADREKLQAGKGVVNDEIGSIADKSVKLDPVLAKRWSKQQERMDDNYVCDIPDVISVADKSTKLDPVLAKRWASGNERLAAGQEVPEVGSRADFSRKDTELAKTFAKMQRQAKRGALTAH